MEQAAFLSNLNGQNHRENNERLQQRKKRQDLQKLSHFTKTWQDQEIIMSPRSLALIGYLKARWEILQLLPWEHYEILKGKRNPTFQNSRSILKVKMLLMLQNTTLQFSWSKKDREFSLNQKDADFRDLPNRYNKCTKICLFNTNLKAVLKVIQVFRGAVFQWELVNVGL